MDLHTGYNISPPRFKVGLIVGHDEYWSSEMRTSVEKARSKGLNLAFFGANICFWQVRFESSPTSLKQNRVMIIYKDDYRIQVDYRDPFYNDRLTINDNLVTTRWRWPPVLYNESLLMGVMYTYDPVIDQDLIIHDGSHWMFSNTSLRTGSRIPGLLGYEVDEMFGVSLPNLKLVMESPFTVLETNATKKSHAVIWRTNAGAYTFSTGR